MRVESIHVEQPRKAQAKHLYPRQSPEHEPAEKKNRSLAGPRTVLDELLDKPCPIHSVLFNTNPTHSLRACWVVRHVAKSGEAILGVTSSSRRSATPPYNDTEVLTIYVTFSSNNKRKRALQELGQVHQLTAANSWTDTPITFNEKDEPRVRHIQAPAALVLDPIVDCFRLTKVLMDRGSGLNLIYEDTLDKMQFGTSRIKKRYTSFQGIIPGIEVCCSGRVTLDVVFGTLENYTSEELLFHIVPFHSGYHALSGRDAYARLQAIPHYGYMKLKMPGPNGVITIASDSDRALQAKNKTTLLALEALSESLAVEELTTPHAYNGG